MSMDVAWLFVAAVLIVTLVVLVVAEGLRPAIAEEERKRLWQRAYDAGFYDGYDASSMDHGVRDDG